MFYGGVCGVSSQLFRVALLHPRITITKRAPHNEWFTVYYGQEVHGDDAAMMQMRKQFEIKNTSDAAVYIRTKKFGETTYIAAISPYKIDDFVTITKTWNSELSVKLTKQIYKKTWKKRRTKIPTPVFPSQDTHMED
jgi:vancomycin resistance protein YoaR